VVFVALEHVARAEKARPLPLRLVSRKGAGDIFLIAALPGAVRFDVRLIDQIDTVFVAQPVPERAVRVVRGAHGVEVVRLQEADIPEHILFRHGAAPAGVPLVAVDALENDAPAVQVHDAVNKLKAPDADF